METGDGWLLRVRVPGGALDPAQLEVIAAASQRWGRGVVEITARANLQIRGVAAGDVEAAAEALVAGGLALADPALDARRAVVASPLTGHDPAEAAGAEGLVTALVAALVAADLPGELPPKFGVVVDTGGAVPVAAVPADLLLTARPDAGGRALWSAVTGPGPRRRTDLGPVDEAALVTVALALAERCAIHGCRAGDLPAAGGQLLSEAAVAAPAGRVGVTDHLDCARVNVVGAPPLGRLDPGQLRRLAAVARRALGLRLTPGGAVALVGVPRAELDRVRRRLHEAGCSTDPADPWATVSACVGTDGCAAARGDTHAAAHAVVAARRTGGPGGIGTPGTDPTGPVHLSGCEKRCGAPAGARLVVAGEDGRFTEVRP
jgi:precorrin-3B synthase